MSKPRHSHTTLPQALGELELTLMQCLWDSPGRDARQLADDLAIRRPTNLSTVQSTLERLVRKGHLTRRKRGHSYLYTPQVSRGEFMGTLLKDVIRLLHDGHANTILNSFVNVAVKLDDSALDELEKLIQLKRRQRERRHE
ncbi:MAG TPA: BlaI/MecI/CopY family transcriptional regulator [Candidatus Acidoferrum sp.]|nr:BlaI/MecI/CopY family transcriptional regulator [Candidatus Acidoferrum sp.]